MKNITHGEFRGLLVLIGLMLLVVAYAWIFKGGVATDDSSYSASPSQSDSILIEEAAHQAAEIDSIRKSRRIEKEHQAKKKRSSTQNRSTTQKHSDSRKKGTPKQQPIPTPSPLDRPLQ